MKKFFLCVLVALSFAGCWAVEKETTEFVKSNTILSATSDITLAVKEESITDTGLILLITNKSSDVFSYDYDYKLEVKKDGQWYRLKIPIAVPSIAAILNEGPGNTHEFHVYWNKGDVSEGEYRIVKGVGKYTLAAEFVYNIVGTEESAESSSAGVSYSAVSGVYQYSPKTKEERFIPEGDFYSSSSPVKASSSKPPQKDG